MKSDEGQTVVSLDLEEEVVISPETDVNEVATPRPEEMTHTSNTLEEDDSESDSDYLPSIEKQHLLEESSPHLEERSKRLRKQTNSYYKCNNMQLDKSECEPITYSDAMSRSDASEWSAAIDRELQTLKDTWTFRDLPVNV